jgi:endonuclease-3
MIIRYINTKHNLINSTTRYFLSNFVTNHDHFYKMNENKYEKKITGILKVLNSLYPEPPIPLNNKDGFTFLVSVVLSAQTTDGKVNQVTKNLFKIAGTPQLLSKMDPIDVQAIIQSVGLAKSKSKYIVNLSKKMIEEFDGQVPNNYKDLESLSGVGHKTASVIMSQLFNEPNIAVDTHVHRLALRWGLSKEEKNVDKVQKDLCALFDIKDWNKVHLQMIYFGREYCTAKDHNYRDCPICSFVNQTNDKCIPLEKLNVFSPKKKSKGIIFYSDRMAELELNPSLAAISPIKSPLNNNNNIKIEIKQEKNISASNLFTSANDNSNEKKDIKNEKKDMIIKEEIITKKSTRNILLNNEIDIKIYSSTKRRKK